MKHPKNINIIRIESILLGLSSSLRSQTHTIYLIGIHLEVLRSSVYHVKV